MSDPTVKINRPITTGLNPSLNRVSKKRDTKKNSSFSRVLNQSIESQVNGLKFSKHAQERLTLRDITLSDSDLDSITKGVETAEKKGVEDTLILKDNIAFIINVPSKTVVTAVDGENLKNNVFTNIDGAVIV